eukprot:15358573-Ditylum_brightwellii.AAC.1
MSSFGNVPIIRRGLHTGKLAGGVSGISQDASQPIINFKCSARESGNFAIPFDDHEPEYILAYTDPRSMQCCQLGSFVLIQLCCWMQQGSVKENKVDATAEAPVSFTKD